ncbi:MAG: symmetrical bis(5'-nucleosyl)-tetraphosphatase [Pseudomonadota bacterium]
MAIYAIGDIQGCYDELRRLLDKINFRFDQDKLWFAGDIVNRGPDSLKTMRFIKSMGKQAVTVLGNHDLTLLAIAAGYNKPKNHTLDEILNAPDRDELINWLRHQKLLHHNEKRGYTMIHAGLYPHWSFEQAKLYALEVEQLLQSDNYQDYFAYMYGNTPIRWNEQLVSWDRIRFITNVYSRMRYSTVSGQLNFSDNNSPGTQQEGFYPWYTLCKIQSLDNKIIFGHWSTLSGDTQTNNIYALDTGCLWGGELTAMKLGKKKQKGTDFTHQFFKLNC